MLEQLRSQTQATELIKAEIQRELSTFRDTLGRYREVVGFHRERIAEHLNIVINAYVGYMQLRRLSQYDFEFTRTLILKLKVGSAQR